MVKRACTSETEGWESYIAIGTTRILIFGEKS